MSFLTSLMVFVAFSIGACGQYDPLAGTSQPEFLKPTNSADFDYPIQFSMDLQRDFRLPACSFYSFKVEATYPQLAGETFDVEGVFILPRRQKKAVPLVALFPPAGGRNILDDGMADSLCLKNIATFIATTDISGIQAEQVPDVQDHNHGMYRTVAYVKALMAYASQDPRLNSEKVGVLGASLGGILSVFAMSVLPEISAGFFAVAGGDFPSILARSNQKNVRNIRSYRMGLLGMTSNDEYEDYLRGQLLYDPLDFAGEIPAEAVRMVISKKDRKVPTANQWMLYEALGRPETKVSRWGHTWTIINAMGPKEAEDDIAEFFVERFRQKNLRARP